MNVLAKRPILQDFVLKRYEPQLGLYFFFNAKNKQTWSCPNYIGEVVSALEGDLSVLNIINILAENNTELETQEIKKLFVPIFEFLFKEEFLANCY